MKKRIVLGLLVPMALATTVPAMANDQLIGALLGAGAGVLIGRNMGGQDGAVVGGALGAAVGASVTRTHYEGGRGGYEGRTGYEGRGGYENRGGYYPQQRPVYREVPQVYYQPAPRVIYPAPQIVYSQPQPVYYDNDQGYRYQYRPEYRDGYGEREHCEPHRHRYDW